MMNIIKEPIATRFFVPPIISGVLLALALPWFGFSFLVWVALVPLLLFVARSDTTYKRAFQGGLISGVVYFSTVVYPLFSLKAWWWLNVKGIVYENKILFLFWILYAAVLAASILFGLFAIVFKKIHKEGFFSIFILGVVWIFLEYVRAKLLFGFTWGHLGYSLHESLPLMQFARYGGVYTLSFLVVLINILLYYTIHRPLKDIEGVEGRAKEILFFRSLWKHWYLYGAAAMVALSFLGGNFLLNKQNKQSAEPNRELSVAIIQPGESENLEDGEKKVFQMVEQSLLRDPSLVIIPESSFPSMLIDETTMKPPEITGPSVSSNLELRGIDSSFAASVVRPQTKSAYAKLVLLSKTHPAVSFAVGSGTQRGSLRYSSVVVIEGGEIKSIYHKRKLFPFSERSVSWFPWKTSRPLTAGENGDNLTIRGEKVSALICSEALFPELAKDTPARFIIALGNDGVFQSPLVAEYNHIVAKFMAVETGKYVARGMKTGVSSIIDPHGREIARSPSSSNEILTGRISY